LAAAQSCPELIVEFTNLLGIGHDLSVWEWLFFIASDCKYAIARARVRSFAQFDQDNDPWQEHDFGAFIVDSENIFWKIDYYGLDMESGSPDPSSPSITRRVLTVGLLSSEY